jgi:hypothetical protein
MGRLGKSVTQRRKVYSESHKVGQRFGLIVVSLRLV